MDGETERLVELQEPLLSKEEEEIVVPSSTTDVSLPSSSSSDQNSSDDNDDVEQTTTTIHEHNIDTNSIIINPWKNHNVILSLLLCIVSGTADSIWGNVILSSFLLALANYMKESKEGNTLVGAAEAAQGLTMLITALPVGMLADTYGKSKIVRFGGILMLITIFIHLWALLDITNNAENSVHDANRSYIILVVALSLWGICSGISYGPSQALYSDSIPRGKRSEMLTWLYTCYLLSSAAGPIVSIILFVTISKDAEDWSIEEIFPVFFIGVCLEIPAAIIMFFFNDKYVVPDDVVVGTGNQEQQQITPSTQQEIIETQQQESVLENNNNNETNNNIVEQEEVGNTPCEDSSEEALGNRTVHVDEPPSCSTDNAMGKKAIPYVLFLSSLVVSLGSGASVKYFPLFFKELGFTSAIVQGIFLLVPIFISTLSFIAQKTSQYIGRIETTVIFSSIGITLLYLMTWLSQDVDGSNNAHNDNENYFRTEASLWERAPHRAYLIVIVYLFRTGIMNCSYPLLESIMMDSVPSNQRARWKSLESIASFGWTGSALLGGILSDEHSYRFTFAITATMQLIGTIILITIRPYVEREGSVIIAQPN